MKRPTVEELTDPDGPYVKRSIDVRRGEGGMRGRGAREERVMKGHQHCDYSSPLSPLYTQVVSDPVGYGFVIRGSRPVYVHAVDPNGPAKAAGLNVSSLTLYMYMYIWFCFLCLCDLGLY